MRRYPLLSFFLTSTLLLSTNSWNISPNSNISPNFQRRRFIASTTAAIGILPSLTRAESGSQELPGFTPLQPPAGSAPLSPPILSRTIAEGSGDFPSRTQKVKVNYELRLNSFQDRIIDKSTGFGSSPIKFLVGVGNVIKAWDLAIMQMRPGEKRFLVVPPEYGYGSVAQGGLLSGIPPDSKLYFVIELVGTEELKKLNDEQLKWLEDNPL